MPTHKKVQPQFRALAGSVAAIVAATGALSAQAKEVAYNADGHPYVKGEMLIKVKSKASLERFLDRSRDSLGSLAVRQSVLDAKDGTWYKVQVKESVGSMFAAREAAQAEGVLVAEPNFIYETQIGGKPNKPEPGVGGPDYEDVPDLPDEPEEDPRLGDLYGLELIDAETAWAVTQGSKDIIVADIDTGVDYNHPDLINNMWRNEAEIPGNGRDDDRNGFVDDIVGWDFRDKDARPFDDNSHGSHTSGTIAATGGNGVGISGVAQRTSIMALRFLGGANGSGTSDDAVKSIQYATANGAHLSSNSWGGGGFSQALYDAIQEAGEAGILFIAAAGNANSDNDAAPSYPASYDLDNIISVAATDSRDSRASFSNYGATTVDLAAPGVQVLSTVPGGAYKSYSGTSMATPHVAGAAALILAAYPDLSAADLKSLLLESVDSIPGLDGVVLTGGRLNIANAFEMARSRFGAPTPR